MAKLSMIDAIKKVINGEIGSEVLQGLRDYFRREEPFLLDHLLWLQFSEALAKYMKALVDDTTQKLTLKDTKCLYYASFFVLDVGLSKYNGKDIVLEKCVPSVFQLIINELAVIKINENLLSSKTLSLMSYLEKFLSVNDKQFSNMYNFLHENVQAVFFCYKNYDIQMKAMALLASSCGVATSYRTIINNILQCIGKDDGKICNRKTSQENVSPLALCVSKIVQQNLSNQRNDMKSAYEKSFSFAANLIYELLNACLASTNCDSPYYKTFESFIGDIITMSSKIEWVSARVILQLLTKVLTSNLLSSKNNKFRVFALKQLPIFANTLKTHMDVYAKVQGTLKGELDDKKTRIKQLILIYLRKESGEKIHGDIHQAYKVVMNQSLDSTEIEDALPDLTPAEWGSLAYVQEAERNKNMDFKQYVKYILHSTSDSNKLVKSAAAKSLEMLIIADPELLLSKEVCCALNVCLNHAAAYGRSAIAAVLKAALTRHPELIRMYTPDFRTLLEDEAPTVRKASIQAITAIVVADKTMRSSKLSSYVLSLVGDPDDSVQKSISDFFQTVWLQRYDYTAHLIEICQVQQSLNSVGTILATLTSNQKATCLSQTPKKNSNKSSLEVLSSLGENVMKLLKSLNLRRKESALSILKIVGDIHPHAVVPHVNSLNEHLIDKMTEESTKKLLVDVMLNTIKYLDKKTVCPMKDWLTEELESETSHSIAYRTALLKLLSKLCGKDKRTLDDLIRKSLMVLRSAKLDESDNDKQIKICLCNLIYLVKDYCLQEEVKNLIHKFLKTRKYNLTVLSMSCQTRLEFVPTQRDVLFETFIGRHLQNRSDEELTITALYFISCTLQGYSKIQQRPDIKELGDSTTETVSGLLQYVLTDILECTIDKSVCIRKRACSVVNLIVQSGLILVPRLLPHILAMTTDTDSSVQVGAKSILKYVAISWNLSGSVAEALGIAFSLADKTSGTGIIRGFDSISRQATFQCAYDFVQETQVKRRKFIDSVITEMTKSNDLFFILYVSDQMWSFKYKYLDELLYALSAINTILIHHAALNSSLIARGNGSLPIRFALYLLNEVKNVLSTTYNITHNTIDEYCSSRSVKDRLKTTRGLQEHVEEDILSVLTNEKALTGIIEQKNWLPDSYDSEDDEPLCFLAQRLRNEKEKRENETVSHVEGDIVEREEGEESQDHFVIKDVPENNQINEMNNNESNDLDPQKQFDTSHEISDNRQEINYNSIRIATNELKSQEKTLQISEEKSKKVEDQEKKNLKCKTKKAKKVVFKVPAIKIAKSKRKRVTEKEVSSCDSAEKGSYHLGYKKLRIEIPHLVLP